ncbi:SIR2 family protein [Mycobacterium sp. pUA109]|uniref:SIR2 family protein n=1 Tax=Mycobacterium sp. pUA109 TaxID=3238982 RepID=UPI00351BD61F
MNDNRVATAVNAIRTALSKKQLVLILGAGVSAAATNGHRLSMWQGLVNDAIDRCVELGERDQMWADRAKADVTSPYDDDLIAAAEKATSGLGGRTNPQYRRWLRDTVGALHIEDTTLTDVIKLYAERGSLIATTNYDDIPSEATGWPAVAWRDNTTIQRVFRGDDHAIIHIHGHWREPASVVFGSSSYADVLSDQHAAEFLRFLVWGKTVVFCGFGAGMRDPNFTALRNWLRTYPNSEYSHYRLARSSEVQTAESEHHADEHITVVPFGATHTDLPTFLDAMLTAGPFRAIDDTQPQRPTPAPTTSGETIPIVIPLASQETRNELAEMAARLAAVAAVAVDTSNPLIGPAGEVIDPAVRDVYIRFQNLFADEAAFVTSAAAASELTHVQADRALGIGRRLTALIDDPPPR